MNVVESRMLADIQPGMRLAEDVSDDAGRVLLPAGCELTESTLLGLARRGIESLRVVCEVEEDPAAREACRAQTCAELDQLFRKAGDGHETRLLYQAILDFRMEHRS